MRMRTLSKCGLKGLKITIEKCLDNLSKIDELEFDRKLVTLVGHL